MKDVCLVGGCGFLGSRPLDRLLRREDLNSIVVVDNLWTGTRGNLAHIDDPRLENEATDRCPDHARCRKVLPGWEAKVPFEEGIRQTIDWFKGALADGRMIAPPPAAAR